MTLVVSLITRNYVLQVSDRRTTRGSGAKFEIVDDEANKAILLENHFIIGYTGVASLGNVLPGEPARPEIGCPAIEPQARTDIWALELLINTKNISEAVECLATETAREFSRIGVPELYRRHAYVIAGWGMRRKDSAELTPVMLLVSNYHDHKLDGLDKPEPTFSCRPIPLSASENYRLLAVGQPFTQSEEMGIHRLVRKALKKPNSQQAVAQVLIRAIREVAERNSAVGKNLMLCILPKSAVPHYTVRVGRIPDFIDEKSFLFAYLPEDTSRSISYIPNTVFQGVAMAGMVTGFGPKLS